MLHLESTRSAERGIVLNASNGQTIIIIQKNISIKKILDETKIYDIIINVAETAAKQKIGLSPNGKATDSDSVIFKVRILVAQLR